MLGVAHELGRDRVLAAQRVAQLADDASSARIQVDMLAHERSAPAVAAAVAIGLQRADAAAQQDKLELFDIALGGLAHGAKFAAVRRAPAGAQPIAQADMGLIRPCVSPA